MGVKKFGLLNLIFTSHFEKKKFWSTHKTFIMVYIEDYCIKCHICFDLEEIKPYFDAIETSSQFYSRCN